MTGWIVLPISLSAFSISGIWIVYAMAVMNHHVCPVENWTYNVTCSDDNAKQGTPKTCCTLDDVPLISKCGTYPPESCLFSLIGNVGAFMGKFSPRNLVYLHCPHLPPMSFPSTHTDIGSLVLSTFIRPPPRPSHCHLSTQACSPHLSCAPLNLMSSVPPSSLTLLFLSGDDLFAEIQSGHRAQPQLLAEHCCSDRRLHQRGRTSHGGKLPGVAFPAGLLFVCLHCILTYHLAATALDYWVGHLRVSLTTVALISLVLSAVFFFIHESFLLQHLAAICEWVFVLDILVFYGTFAYEFGSVSTDTIMVALQSSAARSCKSPGSSSTSTHLNCNPERIAMI